MKPSDHFTSQLLRGVKVLTDALHFRNLPLIASQDCESALNLHFPGQTEAIFHSLCIESKTKLETFILNLMW